MRRFLTLFIMLMLSGVLAFAQNRVVTGKVTDEQGNPVSGATITELGSTNATQADANGDFTIRVGNNARLAITSVGHRGSTITVTGNTVSVTLTRGEELMQEVVVTTALGIRKLSLIHI